jgi:hypothetical protein
MKQKIGNLVLKRHSFPVHSMRVYRGSRGIAPLRLNLDARWRLVVNVTNQPLYRQKRTVVPFQVEARWASEMVWTSFEMNLLRPGFELRAVQPVA